MPDEDLLLETPGLEFGAGVVGVCDICGARQAVIVLSKERYKLCVLDFLNKSWIKSSAKPLAKTPPFKSTREYVPCRAVRGGLAPVVVLSPTKEAKRPSVIVVPEVYGLSTQVLDLGVHLAHEGYEVVMPDFAKTPGINLIEWGKMRGSRRLFGAVHISQARKEKPLQILDACREYVLTRPFVTPEHQAVAGLSYGGTLALAYASLTPGLSGVAVGYPYMIHPATWLQFIKCPIFAVYGGRDHRASVSLLALKDATKRYHIPLELVVVPEVGHDFLSRDHKAYGMVESEVAWVRMMAFMKAQLAPPPAPPKPPVAPPVVTPVVPPKPPSAAAPAATGAAVPGKSPTSPPPVPPSAPSASPPSAAAGAPGAPAVVAPQAAPTVPSPPASGAKPPVAATASTPPAAPASTAGVAPTGPGVTAPSVPAEAKTVTPPPTVVPVSPSEPPMKSGPAESTKEAPTTNPSAPATPPAAPAKASEPVVADDSKPAPKRRASPKGDAKT